MQNPPLPPPPGVYTPLVTFFNDNDSIDFDTTRKHALRIAQGGVVGIVLQGSNGEAPHLLHSERVDLIKAIREALDLEGFTQIKLIVGCGAASVLETRVYMHEAKGAGADYALVLPPAYWAAAMSAPVIESFFTAIAKEAPLPILIYNFPAVTGGIDLSSDSIIKLGRENVNIVGCKLTCGNVGKLQRITSALPNTSFAALGGKSDFFLPALVAGSHGVIAALANLVPAAHVELLRLYQEGRLSEAQILQSKLSEADWALLKGGVSGVKAAIAHFFGYGSGKARMPLPNTTITSYTESSIESLRVVVNLENSFRKAPRSTS